MKSILAIVVLYRKQLAESPTYRALHAACEQHTAIAEAIDLVVADNSPQSQTVPADLRAHYLHDGTNPGLAARYNFALQRAVAEGYEWLLLLDHDTVLTSQYLHELVELSQQLSGNEEIAAIAPKLVEKGEMMSPHLPPYRMSTYRLDLSTYGPVPGSAKVFNSGALVRVKALQTIGGFPETYPLDYLDHATFWRIHKQGGSFFLMNARLEHGLSVNDLDAHKAPGYAARRAGKLSAELRYYRECGTFKERLLHRKDLAWEARQALRHGRYSEAGRLLWGILSWPGAL